MSRTVLIVLALAAAVYADEYAFNQVDEIISRIEVCLKPVPENPSAFDTPAQQCQMRARWSLEDGDVKESLANSVASCLKRYGVDSTIVATAEQCLTKSLAENLKPALEEADYSDAQLDEISNRIKACLSTIPETKYHTPASDCRLNSILEAGEGYPKESLVDFVIPCLNRKKINAGVVAAAEKCIASTLAQPLSS